MQKTNYHHLSISPVQAEGYAREFFGLEAKAKSLAGEVDFNFYLKTADRREFALKVSRPGVRVEDLDFQSSIMQHLQQQELPFSIPREVRSLTGKTRVRIVDANGEDRWVRLQHWVPGRMLAEINPRSDELLQSWGAAGAHLNRALSGFDHPAAHRSYKWNPAETLQSKKLRSYIRDPEQLALADYFWRLFEKEALPYLDDLRQGVNYNDAHGHNLLVSFNRERPEITGVIDFGDTIYTQLINELAIACAYACMELPDPLRAAMQVVKGFHRIVPLEEKEIALLFPLICGRLMISVANAACNKHQEPDNEYLLISERPAWDLLRKWKSISPALAHYSFRSACGWVPCPAQLLFEQWQDRNARDIFPAIQLGDQQLLPLDLSVGSLDLGNNVNFSDVDRFGKTIRRYLEDHGAAHGLGGYAEVRPFYSTDAYQITGNNGVQWRTLHLGTDLWAEAGTAVYASWDGRVHSFQYNEGDRNYGPTIILQHDVSPELTFYTLYGHLDRQALEHLEQGKAIVKGQQIGRIGAPPSNGNWPPHLHFQLILDLLDGQGDFPGVAFPQEKAVWLSLCPDPAHFLPKLTYPAESRKKSAEEVLGIRARHLGKSLSVSYRTPLYVVRGYMQHLYDITARRYLDTVNNVAHVGHEHPRVVRAAQRQMGVLNTNTRYLHEQIVLFAEELLATLPPSLSVVHFVNSGSEANELALRMVEACTGQKDMIAVEVGYHGNTGGCIAVSSYKFDGRGGKGAPPGTHIVPIPDSYRGLYRGQEQSGARYAEHLREAITALQQQGKKPGGFICESILSCGGQIVLPEGYLKRAYRYVRAAGGLCIADEVQVGFGRVGRKFWGFELQEVVPDIVTMGKPIGNGHPLAAVVTTREIAAAFANGMEYFNTFGGNPVSCAVGREVLSIIREENLQQNALKVGDYLLQGLQSLQEQYPIIGDVRGTGLFLGFELVRNPDTLEPATAEAGYLANRMRQRGILMSTDGPHNNVLKIKPPLCFSRQDADFLLNNLSTVMSEDFLRI